MTSSPTKPSGRQSGSTAKPRKRRSKTIQESPRLEPIRVRGCRVHNLQGFDVDIPRNQLTVLCGLSGSGKTSLALDTLYAEGQRCYIESFSAYTRQYLDRLDKPDCDAIENIPPAIAVTRASAVSTNRATVATATEIADHVRLLFSKAATLSCHQCGAVVRADSPQSVAESLAGSAGSLAQNGHDAAKRGLIGFEVHLPNPADASEILLALQQDGYLRLIVQGETFQLAEDDRKRLAKQIGRKGADALIVVDRLSTDGEVARWTESLETAMDEGNGRALVLIEADETPGSDAHLPTATVDGRPFTTRAVSDRRRCERCDLDFAEPVPRLFNFNHPLGACPTCEGFGDILAVDEDRVVPDPDRSLAEGAIAPWNTPAYRHELDELLELAPEYELPVHVPYRKLTKKQRRIVWRGVRERNFGGLDGFFGWLDRKKYKMHIRVFAARYRSYKQCPDCCGARLREDVLAYRVGGRNVAEFLAMQADEALSFLNTWMSGEPDDGQTGQQADRLSETIARYESPYSKLDSVGTEDLVRERSIASEPVRQIRHRLEYLQRVGLGYLQLNRPLRTLSGGETQRIALTSALSSTLINMLYVLDEPTAGLHPEDVHRLSDAILDLRDRGNTVLVVEHNPRLIGLADHVIEIGPGAGPCGGRLTFSGTPQGLIDQTNGLTGPFVLAERSHGDAPAKPKPNARDRRGAIVLRGCTGNNLQNIDVTFPLGLLCVVCGRSGSGKSSLIHDTLHGAVVRELSKSQKDSERSGSQPQTLPFQAVLGTSDVQDCLLVDQSPISRSPRSCPVTYAKAFDEIRKAFAETVDARIRNFKPGHFSFNSAAGQCEACEGAGVQTIDMQFLADVSMRCPQCRGHRYRDEVLQVRYRDRTIADVLEMTVRDAYGFFRGLAKTQARLKRLIDVGLDYVALGQPGTTLSSGEGQRLKLASFLASSSRRKTLFLMDEPTTGLHPADVERLLACFDALIADGHSLVVVEHHPMVIRAADHVIELGPGAGDEGGQLIRG